MSKRKTISVTNLVDVANRYLELPDAPGIIGDQFRHGVAAMIEHVLHDTGNYRGFQYQKSELDERGQLRENFNNSRRLYYHPAP